MDWGFESGRIVASMPATLNKAIDCFSLKPFPDYDICLRNDTENGVYFNHFRSYGNYYHLIKGKDRQMKLIESTQLENISEPFDGTLEGIPITAAYNWTQSDKEFLYFFAGRHLCRQEINQNDWVPMCDIEDIANWVKCPKGQLSFPHILVIVFALALVIFLVILLIYFLWSYKAKSNEKANEKPKEKPKFDQKAKQNASTASIATTRSGLK